MFNKLAETASIVIGKIYDSPMWGKPSYNSSLPRTELQEMLVSIVERLEKLKELQSRNEDMAEDMSEETYKKHRADIAKALDSIAKEIIELDAYAKNLESLAEDYHRFEKESEVSALSNDLTDAVAQSKSTFALQSVRFANEEALDAQRAIRKIIGVNY